VRVTPGGVELLTVEQAHITQGLGPVEQRGGHRGILVTGPLIAFENSHGHQKPHQAANTLFL
jgi:hypothetical protein